MGNRNAQRPAERFRRRVRDYGMLGHTKQLELHKNALGLFPRKRTRLVAYVGGKRETRRLLGDYILKEDDLVETCRLRRRIIHGIMEYRPPPSRSEEQRRRSEPVPYDPTTWRFMRSLLIAIAFIHPVLFPLPLPLFPQRRQSLCGHGRNISCTHVALGTVRVMRTQV